MSASIITSVVTGGSNSHATVSEELNAYATDFVTQGVLGTFATGTGAFAVTQDASPDMGVTVLLGVAYISGTPNSQDAQVVRARMTSNYTEYTISSNSSGSTKYDWIYLSFSSANATNPDSAADNVVTLFTSRSSSSTSDNGSPPTYGLLLGIVTVANGASSITTANIADKRVQATINYATAAGSNGWQTLGFPLTYGANNGNKEFTVTTSNNLTGLLSPGMKLNVTRSVTPPTQCMAFTAASSQYATKATPSGITFTTAFTCEAWVFLISYPGTNGGYIISRYDGSADGFALRINVNGQPDLFYASSGSFTESNAAQTIPLNQWVHIAGVVSSTSAKTLAIYINGVSVPIVSQGTGASTITQAGNLSIGAANTGLTTSFLNGFISEARIWSTGQTQSSIQSNMAISLTGSESNLVALFQGNGNFNDATTNANNLTATNSAIATQAANPYNAIEYGIITKVSFSNPTTTVTLFTGSISSIPNQTLNLPVYSTVESPFGFSSAEADWAVITINTAFTLGTPSSTNTLFNDKSLNIIVPTGKWKLGFEGALEESFSVSSVFAPYGGLSTSPTAASDQDLIAGWVSRPGSTGSSAMFIKREKELSITSATPYYLVVATQTAGGTTTVGFDGGPQLGNTIIRAVCAYI